MLITLRVDLNAGIEMNSNRNSIDCFSCFAYRHFDRRADYLPEPTAPMLTEAASAGFYKSENFPEKYPRLQILTIAELLADKQLRYPHLRDDTFKKAKRKQKGETSQSGLFR